MQQSAVRNCCYLLPPFFTQYFRQPLKLLLVGTDHATQTSIQTYLPTSYYKITACDSGVGALRYLREKGPDSFDLVLSDIALKDIDGYQFIREQHLNPNIAHVAICGGERSTYDILTAYRSGACSVLWKPVSELGDEIGNLWRHVCRRREQHERTSKTHDVVPQNQNKGSSSSLSPKDTSLEEDDYLEFVNHGGEPASRKRRRVSWKDIHPLFVNAVNQLGGPENAKSSRIIEIMKVAGLTRAHVGSHLQKYRERLKRMEEEQRHLYNNNRAHQPIQMQIQPPEQNFNNFGHVVPASGSFYYITTTGGANNDGIINKKQAPGTSFGSNMPHLPQIGTSFGSNQNLTYGVQQPDQGPASGSSSYVNATRIAHNEGIINQKQALSTSFRSNMQQQPQIGTNLTSSMQQLNQNPASGSSYYISATGGANNDRIINKKQAPCTSFGSNMPQQPHIGTSFGSNQNLTYGVQQPDQDPVSGHVVPASGSSYYITTTGGANNDGIINQKQAPGTSFGSNMPQQQHIGTSFGSNQNLTYGVQQPDQDPASASTSYATTARDANNDGTINQNQAISFRSETLQQPQISQDQNLEAGGHGGIMNTEATHVTKDDVDFCMDVEKIFELLDDYEP